MLTIRVSHVWNELSANTQIEKERGCMSKSQSQDFKDARDLRKPGIDYGRSIEATNFGKDFVEEFAVTVNQHFKFFPGEERDIVKQVVNRLGGHVHDVSNWELLDSAEACIYVHGKNDFDIGVSEHVSSTRRNFSIAHELGHYFLHSEQGKKPIIANRDTSTPAEWEANWFAASLLMPEQDLRKDWDEASFRFSHTRLLEKYKVSPAALRIRLENLGLH